MMRTFICSLSCAIGALFLLTTEMPRASADDLDRPARVVADKAPPATGVDAASTEKIPEMNLLEAKRQGLVSTQAEGRGDGRMTVCVTNRTKRKLRVVLPPGIIAQSATGQFGGIGGMGGGMGGMGGGIGGMGGIGGGLGRNDGIMPPIMGMMMLSRNLMYFCGDPDSWEKRSPTIGMIGGRVMRGGIGGGMRSVPTTELPSALLSPGQTRNLPTRLVLLTPPAPPLSMKFPEKGEPLQLCDIADINENPRVQKALRRLATDAASKSIARLVMWHLTAGLDWDSLAVLSGGWANRYEMTLARDFVDHLDSLPSGETGRVLLEAEGKDAAGEVLAVEVRSALRRKVVLGLIAEIGIPARPAGPAVALRVRMSATDARVLVHVSDAAATNWVPMGLFTVPLSQDGKKSDVGRLTDAIAEGALDHLVRVRLSNGVKDEDRTYYQLCVDNGSPLVLNGVAAVGVTSGPGATPRVLSGICLPPRKSLAVAASEEVVDSLGLKKGIKLIALDLSGL
jgi:hypothetical protein